MQEVTVEKSSPRGEGLQSSGAETWRDNGGMLGKSLARTHPRRPSSTGWAADRPHTRSCINMSAPPADQGFPTAPKSISLTFLTLPLFLPTTRRAPVFFQMHPSVSVPQNCQPFLRYPPSGLSLSLHVPVSLGSPERGT